MFHYDMSPACWCTSRITVLLASNFTYLYWHPVALKVDVDDVANLLRCTMLAGHHDVQQLAGRVYLQGLTHSSCQAEGLGWPTALLQRAGASPATQTMTAQMMRAY